MSIPDLDAIPLLTSTLGYTYDVPRGKYADPTSCKQQVIPWENYITPEASFVESYGGKQYRIPKLVDFRAHTTSSYTTTYGNSALEYSESLSISASVSIQFPGFSGSASSDYSSSERNNVANSFTRISYNVSHYIISLPSVAGIRSMVDPEFIKSLDAAAALAQNGNNVSAFSLFDDYGTHLLRSAVVGGRGAFTSSTDTREYGSSISIEAAAKISASYLIASGSASLSVAQEEARKEFNSSSRVSVQTEGGNPRYGNENFVKNVEEWSESIMAYPSFIEFGPSPSLIGLWELCSSSQLTKALQNAYGPYTNQYSQSLALPGPYLRSRLTRGADLDQEARFWFESSASMIIRSPSVIPDNWYLISPGNSTAVIAQELGTITGILAPVAKWKTVVFQAGDIFTKFWLPVPPSKDYVALGCVGLSAKTSSGIPDQPPARLTDRFRVVHKRALTAASSFSNEYKRDNTYINIIDTNFYIITAHSLVKQDCFGFHPGMVNKENWY